jgi:hypothetical protein
MTEFDGIFLNFSINVHNLVCLHLLMHNIVVCRVCTLCAHSLSCDADLDTPAGEMDAGT